MARLLADPDDALAEAAYDTSLEDLSWTPIMGHEATLADWSLQDLGPEIPRRTSATAIGRGWYSWSPAERPCC